MEDPISRQAVIDALWSMDIELRPSAIDEILNMLNGLPSAQPEQPEIIRCKDCKWWGYDDDDGAVRVCHAAKHGHMSSHWSIMIYRQYKGDYYCADAERRE